MAQNYMSGADSSYGNQTYWPTSTAMTRNTSHESNYSNYSGSSNGQYDVALSPSSEFMGSFDLTTVPDGGSYIAGGQGYDAGNQAQGTGFQFQYYDFVTAGDSGQGPYWQLKPGYIPSMENPATIPVEPSPDVPRSASDSTGRHVCLEPFCSASPFKRKADLQRHYLHRHRDAHQKKAFPCDWKRCGRSKDPFYRLDHCREHYRDYHLEDLKPRGPKKESSEWWNTRKVDSKWFRCTKCLSRIPIDSKGWECAKCKTACEPERRNLRGYK
ncbi:hypothetical protein F4677DRAFT_277168 [Hypoxylon crocopeplum]|nr:hypothetical protein F4677DRAFT_277168 [Hypoxylon crocopeplum]